MTRRASPAKTLKNLIGEANYKVFRARHGCYEIDVGHPRGPFKFRWIARQAAFELEGPFEFMRIYIRCFWDPEVGWVDIRPSLRDALVFLFSYKDRLLSSYRHRECGNVHWVLPPKRNSWKRWLEGRD